MNKTAKLIAAAFLAAMSACKRRDSVTGEPVDTRHYSRADFRAKCFKLPDQNDLIGYKAMLHLDAQAALDYQYRQDLKNYPAGNCDVLNPDGTIKLQPAPAAASSNTQTGWMENAPGNDMSHYGDALPGGRRH